MISKEVQCQIDTDIFEINLKTEEHNKQLNFLIEKLVVENKKQERLLK